MFQLISNYKLKITMRFINLTYAIQNNDHKSLKHTAVIIFFQKNNHQVKE